MSAEKTEPFVISRSLDAPRSLVWKAWTEAERLAQWWGPKGFTVKIAKLDLRPGGTLHYCLNAPNGDPMWGLFRYREIVAPEKVVFINCFSDEEGGITRHPWSPSWPLEMLSTISFTEQGSKTMLTIQWEPLNATAEEIKTFNEGRAGMVQGWSGTFEQLAAYLESAK